MRTVLTGRSLWLDQLSPQPQRPTLNGSLEADVVVVGGGFTGLWTAYYLKQLNPSLSVVVVERHHVGFGASGRNGGWVVAEFACGLDKYAAMSSHDEALRLVRELHASVDEIGSRYVSAIAWKMPMYRRKKSSFNMPAGNCWSSHSGSRLIARPPGGLRTRRANSSAAE